jgi:hypothetical protein
MVTTESLRSFAADCLAWASVARDPSQKQMMLEAARCWEATAEAIERHVDERVVEALPDLRRKLN